MFRELNRAERTLHHARSTANPPSPERLADQYLPDRLLTALGSTHTAALPLVQDPGSAAVGMILIADQEPTKPETPTQTGDSEKHTPFIELNEELAAARARLEELAKAGAVAAPSRELQWLRAENQRLAAEVAKLRASSDELQTARKGAEEHIAEMAKAVEQAAAQAKRIEEVLVAMRWQNRQLNTNLAHGQAVREKIEREARDAQEKLSAKVETLSNSAEQSAAEITRLHARLDESQRQLKAAVGSRETAETRLAELNEALQRAENEIIRSDEQLRALRSRFTQAAAERAEDDVRIAELQSQGEQLRAALASAQNDVDRLTRSKRDLEEEVTMLRGAASTAADAARQTLLAVEERINELNAALGEGVESGAELNGPAAEATIVPDTGAVDAAMVRAIGRPGAVAEPVAPPLPRARPEPAVPANAAADEPQAAAQAASVSTPPEQGSAEKVEMAATATTKAAVGADQDEVKSALTTDRELDPRLIQLTANLPPEKRRQVQGVLGDLNAKPDQRGLLLTVPGASLFDANIETIEPSAHGTLAKLADLIETYDDRKVMIIGHTDSIGEEAYNKVLSQRRADLVKQSLIDHFELDSTRLLTQGQGESEPIATNSTLEGRQANRRVEVLILN